MKKVTVIFIAILLVILAVRLKDSFSISSDLEARESNDGPVSVAVAPRSLEGASWNFDITLNTHSEELSEDLVAVSQLLDDQGKSYKPTAWEGAPPGGHHRQGILKFNSISPKPKSIELKMSKLSPSEIKNVGGIPERSFKWTF